MALIKTIAEIKEVLPKLVASTSNMGLQPNFDRFGGKYVVPLIGQTLYDILETNYNADTLTTDELKLVKMLRLIIAPNGYNDELGMYNLSLGDTGPRKYAQGGTDRVYGWEMQLLQKSLVTAANDGVEITLNYLFETADLWPEWTDSNEYKKIAELILRTGTEFNNDGYTIFQPQRSFFIMRGVMRDVQELFLEGAIGEDLLIYLRDADELTEDEAKCMKLLKKALAYLTVMQACKHFSVSFSDNGFTILGERSSNAIDNQANQPMDLKLLELKIRECEKQGQDFLAKARAKLVELYNSEDPEADFVTAYEKGPLINYVNIADRTSGNETRKIFRF
jgi:hypothetical protein